MTNSAKFVGSRGNTWRNEEARSCPALINALPSACETNPVAPAADPATMNTEYKLSDIRQIAITVSDVGTALPFYRDVLGLTFLFTPAPTLAFLAAGRVRVMVTTPQGAGAVGQNSFFYFKVTAIAATHAATVARGAKSERSPQLTAKMPDHELWTAFVRDPDGNLIGLMEEKR
jgi:predicted enzyme related to lactoylglutathione lyase